MFFTHLFFFNPPPFTTMHTAVSQSIWAETMNEWGDSSYPQRAGGTARKANKSKTLLQEEELLLPEHIYADCTIHGVAIGNLTKNHTLVYYNTFTAEIVKCPTVINLGQFPNKQKSNILGRISNSQLQKRSSAGYDGLAWASPQPWVLSVLGQRQGVRIWEVFFTNRCCFKWPEYGLQAPRWPSTIPWVLVFTPIWAPSTMYHGWYVSPSECSRDDDMSLTRFGSNLGCSFTLGWFPEGGAISTSHPVENLTVWEVKTTCKQPYGWPWRLTLQPWLKAWL